MKCKLVFENVLSMHDFSLAKIHLIHLSIDSTVKYEDKINCVPYTFTKKRLGTHEKQFQISFIKSYTE